MWCSFHDKGHATICVARQATASPIAHKAGQQRTTLTSVSLRCRSAPVCQSHDTSATCARGRDVPPLFGTAVGRAAPRCAARGQTPCSSTRKIPERMSRLSIRFVAGCWGDVLCTCTRWCRKQHNACGVAFTTMCMPRSVLLDRQLHHRSPTKQGSNALP